MPEKVNYQKELEVRYTVDVLVAGGGPAGVAAAVSCAEQGRKVLLVEPFPAFGGAAANMLVPAFMQFDDGEHFLAGGIGRRVWDALMAEADARYERPSRCGSIAIENLKRVYDRMVTASGARFLFYTEVVDVGVDDGRIAHVVCSDRGGLFAVRAKVFIDCTGSAVLSARAGAETAFGDENGQTMAATLCSLWSGINWRTVFDGGNRQAARLDDAFRDHVFTNEDRHLPGMWFVTEQSEEDIPDGVGGANIGHVYNVDERDSVSLTEGIVRGRQQLTEYRRYYKEYVTGFEHAEPVVSAPYLGIREGRRVSCDYRLVMSDFLNRASFPDEIGRYAYPVDIHSSTNDEEGYRQYAETFRNMRYGKGESYGIPLRSLLVKGFANLLVAGRCICTDRAMESSVRVMPGCFITGQAAGIAAAVACEQTETDIHRLPVGEVQKRLSAMGAYLPNFRPEDNM